MGGTELHTIKRLQGWSRFGSIFFLSEGCAETLTALHQLLVGFPEI